ncbi:DUF4198 domain-containing protein [Marimonas sp. MJW-29]|uniref:DUF4198 domain-containing protein n=1 Tax=Sulfitobacter sediminis TaxID=3234186 RepID=A0ABV3RSE1_9RHOB
MILPRLFLFALLVLPVSAAAHEFWIEPERYQVDAGERLQAKFKNGQLFRGSTLSFFDRSSARFDMITQDGVSPITPRAGDSPALDIPAPEKDGLTVVVHETTPAFVTYREWEKFLAFAEHKDFASAEADHIAAGWPQEMFRERYTRHAKALFAVGDGMGTDRAAGLKTEFVALTNPYDRDFDNVMRVSVLLDGTPRPDAQVEVFDRAPDDTVTVTLYRTDASGEAQIPVTPGHEYLFDAVVLQKSPDTGDKPDLPILWETFWAALTFEVPQ